jgi:predicted Zn-dependent protease
VSDYDVVKKNESPVETGFPNQFGSVGSSVSTEKILENADGYKRLGLFDEARPLCETIAEDDMYWEHAQFLLIGLDLDQERMSDAANRGLKVLSKGGASKAMVLIAAMAVHQSGDPQKAYGILMANQEMFRDDAEAAYSFACYAAPAGEIDFAIKALLFNYKSDKKYGYKSCLDADLEQVWVRGAAGNVSLESSLALAHPAMIQAIETSVACRNEMPIDYVLKNQVPGNYREFLRVHPVTGLYTLDRETPADIRERYLVWQQDYKARTMQLAQKAIQLAKEVVLDNQLEWAVEKAQAGNLIAARYHVLFALAYRPRQLRRLAQALRPLGMDYLFDELMYAEAFEPEFCAKQFRVMTVQDSGQVALARELLDEIPPNLQSLTICLLRRANIENKRGYRDFATRLYRTISQRWPQDPVGYYNAIENLMTEEKWDEAKRILDQAPENYRVLALSKMQQEQLDQKSTDRKSSKEDVFYGQPEWDEKLKIIPVVKKELFQFGKK